MNPLLTWGLNWISQPQNIITVVGLLVAIPAYIKKVKEAEGKNTWNKIIKVAREESLKLFYTNMSNDQKRIELENRVIELIPPKQLEKVDPEKVRILLEGVYHAIIKPENKGDKK